jgi:hypothetical protein
MSRPRILVTGSGLVPFRALLFLTRGCGGRQCRFPMRTFFFGQHADTGIRGFVMIRVSLGAVPVRADRTKRVGELHVQTLACGRMTVRGRLTCITELA